MTSGVFARDDTMFGVCQALGEDFGFSPTILRVLFGVGLFWGPLTAIALYAGCGVLVAASRWLVPEARLMNSEWVDAPANEDQLDDRTPPREEMALAA